ncbi:MAG TPA: hypothetical protein PK339_13545 [Flavitalea sp.]|nr:hypothetical protein [Flavitalea sp.]
MMFRDVIGQYEIKKHLVDMVMHNRLSHALLFLAKEGSGGLPLAIAFARYIMCEKVSGGQGTGSPSLFGEEPAEDLPSSFPPDACGACSSCSKTAALVHPDIHFSYPVIPRKPGDKPLSADFISEWRDFVAGQPYGNAYDWLQFIGAENKQGNISAHECNEIIRKLSLKSFESRHKILILWMPEYLGAEGNKLLKLIEEPPPDTLFILVAENESLILPTILSRTQLVKAPPIETIYIEQAMTEKAGISPEQARQIALIAEGNYREAQQLVGEAGDDWEGLLREWLNAILRSGPIAQVKWIEGMSKQGREKQKQFLRYFNHLLHQAIRLQVMGDHQLPLPENERDFAIRLNKMAGIAQQQAIIEELDKASYHIERNANGKMLFHALTIKLYHIIADKSLILIG